MPTLINMTECYYIIVLCPTQVVLGTAGSQWTTDECNRFRADVDGKPFCAIIVDESQDPLFGDEIPIFSLVLIDTSGASDRYVHTSYSRKR